MRSLLTSEYNDTDCVEDEEWPMNSACVCKWEDECWYRGTVKEQKEDQNYIVMFVDYGTTSIVRARDMRKVNKSYADTPAYARRIVLKDIIPPQGEGKIRKIKLKRNHESNRYYPTGLPTSWTKEQVTNMYDAIHYTTGKA